MTWRRTQNRYGRNVLWKSQRCRKKTIGENDDDADIDADDDDNNDYEDLPSFIVDTITF